MFSSITTNRFLGMALMITCLAGLEGQGWAQAPGSEGQSLEACRQWEAGSRVATISSDRIRESSGLAASRRNPGYFWTHNDSGDKPTLFAFDKEGTVAGEFDLAGIAAIDWEDMAAGPCSPDDQKPCLYVGDFGDNKARRTSVYVYRFPEPEITPGNPEKRVITDFDTIEYTYPSGPTNAEVLLVHPKSAEIYIVEKTMDPVSHVWKIPRKEGLQRNSAVTATPAGEIRINETSGLANLLTAGDIAPNGREVTLRSYLRFYTFCLSAGTEFERVFESQPAESVPRAVLQGEALAYGLNGDAIWITSEKVPTPLIRIPASDPFAAAEDAGSAPSDDVGMAADDARQKPARPSPGPRGCDCRVVWMPTRNSPAWPLALSFVTLLLLRSPRQRSAL